MRVLMIQPHATRTTVTQEGSRATGIMYALVQMQRAKPAWMHNPKRHCRDYPTEMFFGSDDATVICEGCPVRDECLDFALDTGEDFGVWGGTSERSRRRIQRVINRAIRESG